LEDNLVPLCAIFLPVILGEKSWQVLQILNGNHWFLAGEKGQLGEKIILLIIHPHTWVSANETHEFAQNLITRESTATTIDMRVSTKLLAIREGLKAKNA
jgi:hypothetical protein